MNTKLGALIFLVSMNTACQLALDLSDYRFDARDAGPDGSPLGSASSDDDPERPAPADVAAALEPMAPLGDAGGGEATSATAGDALEPSTPAPNVEPAPEPELEPEPEPSPPDPVNGCSIIEYCYAHQVQDTTDEERCIQRGCSLDAAIAECRAEIAQRCGTDPQPPFVMITEAGARLTLN